MNKKNRINLTAFFALLLLCSCDLSLHSKTDFNKVPKYIQKNPYSIGVLYNEKRVLYKMANEIQSYVDSFRTLSLLERVLSLKKSIKEEKYIHNVARWHIKPERLLMYLKKYIGIDTDSTLPIALRLLPYLTKSSAALKDKGVKPFKEYIKQSSHFSFIKESSSQKKTDYSIKILNYGPAKLELLDATEDNIEYYTFVYPTTNLFLVEIIDNRTNKRIIKRLFFLPFNLHNFMQIINRYLLENPYRPYK